MTRSIWSLSLLAALAYWGAWATLLPAEGLAGAMATVGGVLALAAPVLTMLDRRLDGGLGSLADGLSVAAPVLGAVLLLWPALTATPPGPAAEMERALAAFRAWPLIVAGLAVAVALNGPPGPGAALAGGASAFVLVFSVLVLPGQGGPNVPLEVLAGGPVHLSIAFLTCAVLVLQAHAFLTARLGARAGRFMSALIGMLPLLGFLGSIAGIITALSALPELFNGATPDADALQKMLTGLATAFETTLLGLLAALLCGFIGALLEAHMSSDRA